MEITNSDNTRVLENIINMMITVQLKASKVGKSLHQINFIPYQDDLHLHCLEMQISMDIQTLLIRTNAVFSVHDLIKPENNLDVLD